MKKLFSLVTLFVLLALLLPVPTAAESMQRPLPKLTAQEQETYGRFLKEHWQTPEHYVVSKFAEHDIVFLGEWHRISHDVKLVQNLIPMLYKSGVYNLGIEFGAYDFQPKVDELITGQKYDEQLARKLLFDWRYDWGYEEYEDLYRAVWKLNHSLPAGSPKFRVVNLKTLVHHDLEKPHSQMTKADWQAAEPEGDEDKFMAAVIQREFVDKNQKALIYSGMHHAFTSYQQPIYDFDKKRLYKLNSSRMGNLVYAKIKNRAFNILLHCPWGPDNADESEENQTYPARGIIDAIMPTLGNKRVGFDLKNSPFGEIKDEHCYYAIAHDGFKLGDLYDGYIYEKPLAAYRGCTVDAKFIDDSNFKQLLADLSDDPEFQAKIKTPADMTAYIRKMADIHQRVRVFWE